MANRLNAPNQFEALSPPWLLTSLDTNFTQNQSAWNDSSLGFVNGVCTDTGSSTAYVISTVNLPFGAPSAYNPGMTMAFIPANTNTGAATIQVGLLGTAAILTPAGNALLGGEITVGAVCTLMYSSVAPVGFRIIGPCPALISATISSGTTTLECAGCTSVSSLISFTGTAGNLTLNHVAGGVSVGVRFFNNSGSSHAYSLTVNDPSGTIYANVSAVVAGGIGGLSSILPGTGITLGSGTSRVFTGVTFGTTTGVYTINFT